MRFSRCQACESDISSLSRPAGWVLSADTRGHIADGIQPFCGMALCVKAWLHGALGAIRLVLSACCPPYAARKLRARRLLRQGKNSPDIRIAFSFFSGGIRFSPAE